MKNIHNIRNYKLQNFTHDRIAKHLHTHDRIRNQQPTEIIPKPKAVLEFTFEKQLIFILRSSFGRQIDRGHTCETLLFRVHDFTLFSATHFVDKQKRHNETLIDTRNDIQNTNSERDCITTKWSSISYFYQEMIFFVLFKFNVETV